MFTLTTDQQNALEKSIEFIDKKCGEPVLVISGPAGVGKSKLTKCIVEEILKQKISVVGVAPTHKAKNILSNFINDDVVKISVITIACLLGKIRNHSYIGTKTFEQLAPNKFEIADIFIIDEISMVEDKSLEQIMTYLTNMKKKAILIGDKYQIPSPSQNIAYSSNGNYCFKKDSVAFKLQNHITLTTQIRQEEGSDILRLATYVRENINSEIEIPDKLKISKLAAYEEFASDWNKSNSTKFIAYTNLSVKEHNFNIRRQLKLDSRKINVGENLIAHKNIGFPKLIIENGRDYIVGEVVDVSDFQVGNFKNLKGCIVECIGVPIKLFFIDIYARECAGILNEMINRAQMVNARHSTKDTWKKYNMLASKIFFINNVYKYNDVIYEEMHFKKLFPLLFMQTNKFIEKNKILNNNFADEIQALFPRVLTERIRDNKIITDQELLADRFMVLEKTMDYGYCITAHKSQSSTFENVFVDLKDFDRIRDVWNSAYQCVEIRFREKNQLIYVAITRAAKKLRIVF